MGTDIYGAIEILDPDVATLLEYNTLWVHGMDLHPLYQGGDYASLGCLFGIRNWQKWEPVAERRGLPVDVSDAVRQNYEHLARIDAAIGGSTWISWPELRDLDMGVTPSARGVLDVIRDGISLRHCYRIEDEWPAKVLAEFGPPPLGENPEAASYGSWRQGTTSFAYKKVTRNDVLGPGTGWEHVFAVMGALAQRFGEDGVRLVVWFD